MSNALVPIEGISESLPVSFQEGNSKKKQHSMLEKATHTFPKKRNKKVTVRTLQQMKTKQKKISMLTVYDALFARILDQQEIDMFLVGDSLGMVLQGQENTLNVTMEQMVYHTQCVSRGTTHAMIVADMPFMSYQISPEEALRNAGRLIQAGAQAVKLEGAGEYLACVKKISHAGIPVVGHLGLTPQSVHAMGGFVVQGKTEKAAQRLLEDALALQEAGAFCLVLEGIPASVAESITEALHIPTIGIGAGLGCDGQVLVLYDMLGFASDVQPKFVKQFGSIEKMISEAVSNYKNEVQNLEFPSKEHSFF